MSKIRRFLNGRDIEKPLVLKKNNMLYIRILSAVYGNENAYIVFGAINDEIKSFSTSFDASTIYDSDEDIPVLPSPSPNPTKIVEMFALQMCDFYKNMCRMYMEFRNGPNAHIGGDRRTR